MVKGKEEGLTGRHSPESWKDLWELEIFPDTRKPEGDGVKVRVDAGFGDGRRPRVQDATSSRGLVWSVTVI